MPHIDPDQSPRKPWSAGRIIGPKPPLKPKHLWAIRQQLKNANKARDLAMFNCAIDGNCVVATSRAYASATSRPAASSASAPRLFSRRPDGRRRSS